MAKVEPSEKLYFDFLELLSKKGLFGEIDVSDKLREMFENDALENLERYGDLNGFLKDISKYGHFTFRNDTKSAAILGNKDWLSEIKASMALTPEGLLFLYEKKKIDQSVKSNNLTLLFIIVTASIGLGSLIISSINLSFTIKNSVYKQALKQKEIHTKQSGIPTKISRNDSNEVNPYWLDTKSTSRRFESFYLPNSI